MISRVKNEHGNSENRIENGRQEKRPMKKEKEKIREGKKKKKKRQSKQCDAWGIGHLRLNRQWTTRQGPAHNQETRTTQHPTTSREFRTGVSARTFLPKPKRIPSGYNSSRKGIQSRSTTAKVGGEVMQKKQYSQGVQNRKSRHYQMRDDGGQCSSQHLMNR